jgi:hypothetical protein
MTWGNNPSEKDEYHNENLVSFWIPVKLCKIGESKCMYYYVIRFTKGGYQFNSYFGMIFGRYAHSELNTINGQPGDGTIPHIEKLIVKKTNK